MISVRTTLSLVAFALSLPACQAAASPDDEPLVIAAGASLLMEGPPERLRDDEDDSSRLRLYYELADEAAPCPAELLLEDPAGRRSGYDPVRRSVVLELPRSAYLESNLATTSPCHEPGAPDLAPRLAVRRPTHGEYRLTLIGTLGGEYRLVVSADSGDRARASRRELVGVIEPGDRIEYRFHVGEDGRLGEVSVAPSAGR